MFFYRRRKKVIEKGLKQVAVNMYLSDNYKYVILKIRKNINRTHISKEKINGVS